MLRLTQILFFALFVFSFSVSPGFAAERADQEIFDLMESVMAIPEESPGLVRDASGTSVHFIKDQEPVVASEDVQWISATGSLYIQPEMTAAEKKDFFQIVSEHLGIGQDGGLDVEKANRARQELNATRKNMDWLSKRLDNAYFKDKLSLLGYNYLFFEFCTLESEHYKTDLLDYFQNGFFPHKTLFSDQDKHYYKILYLYLYNIQEQMVSSINSAISVLNNGQADPGFGEQEIQNFQNVVDVCTRLDAFRHYSGRYEKVFTKDERLWLSSIIDYFLSINTHVALNSYEWFHKHLPLSITSEMVAHEISKFWDRQIKYYRNNLPLGVLALEDAEGNLQIDVEELFANMLNLLQLDNREVDRVVMTTMKIWLSKQEEHGISQRKKYGTILEELNQCPTGWIFYNLYACREPIEKMKQYVDTWETYDPQEQETIFKEEVVPAFYTARDHIGKAFDDIEKIFGEKETLGKGNNPKSISYIFHKYRGEIDYYHEYLNFMRHKDEPGATFALANDSNRCLDEFKTAFVKNSDKEINHINLLNAYNLLFTELIAEGDILKIREFQKELDAFVSRKGLGRILAHSKNNLYDIYNLIALAYADSADFREEAFTVARKGLDLAMSYYMQIAEEEGFIRDGQVGACVTAVTQKDDYERQFEFYRSIAQKIGVHYKMRLGKEYTALYDRILKSNNI